MRWVSSSLWFEWAAESSFNMISMVVSLSCVCHTQRAPLSKCAHSHTCMCALAYVLKVLTLTLNIPIQTYIHTRPHAQGQAAVLETVESCWGTLNRKECSLFSKWNATYQLSWFFCAHTHTLLQIPLYIF